MGMDNYTVTVAPVGLPVTLPEVKTWCRKTTCDEDDLLLGLLNSAVQKAELITNRVFITRTYEGFVECLNCSKWEKGYFFQIRRAPLIAVSKIEVMVNDALVTIEDTEYNVKQTSGFSRIIFEEVNDSPDLVPYPYKITFTAGYGVAADVPDPIKTAIKMMVSYWRQQRGDCDGEGEIPSPAMGILDEYRILNTYG